MVFEVACHYFLVSKTNGCEYSTILHNLLSVSGKALVSGCNDSCY